MFSTKALAWGLCVATICAISTPWRGAGSAEPQQTGEVKPLNPCGLVAEAGIARVYLDWNPSTFPGVTGYHVYRAEKEGAAKRLTSRPVQRPQYVDASAVPGLPYRYTVTAVDAALAETPPSPTAPVVLTGKENPQRRGDRIVFHDGQEIEFDGKTFKLIGWKSGGVEVALPVTYGPPLGLASFDQRGLSTPRPATAASPPMGPALSLDYTQAEATSWQLEKGRAPAWRIEDGRVEVSYGIALIGYGIPERPKKDFWTMARVWETWYPVERQIGPTRYRGLARRIELDVPSIYQDGFQLVLNDAFAPGGSIAGAVSYRTFTWSPRAVIIHWDPNAETAEIPAIRTSYPQPFHPDQDLLNVHPFLFVDHPKGTLIVTAGRGHFAIHAAWSSYAQQGKPGLWPNLAVDLDNPGRRFVVETFEYLFSPDRTLPAVQRYLDARFHYFGEFAHRYGLRSESPWTCVSLRQARYDSLERYAAAGDAEGRRLSAEGVALSHSTHENWLHTPYATPELMHDANAPANRAIAQFNAGLKRHGVAAGFWFRPETATESRGNLFSDHFWTTCYAREQTVPPIVERLQQQGIPLIRENPQWLRSGRGGKYPDELPSTDPAKQSTAYHWTPMSLQGGWYDRVLVPTFRMARRLGYTAVFFDGGFGGFSGVDYASGRAVAMQPSWTRVIRTASDFGLAPVGECGIAVGPWFCFGPAGPATHGKRAWIFAGCSVMSDQTPADEAWMHRLHQIHALPFQARGAAPRAHAFAKDFLQRHGPPARIVLDGLRPGEDPNDRDDWVWDKVFWEYADGRRVEYPNQLP